jgi:hypothetical protein
MERDKDVLASSLFALRCTGQESNVPEIQAYLDHEDWAVRLAAAVAIARLAGPATPSKAVSVLAEAVGDEASVERYEHLPEEIGYGLTGLAGHSLCTLGPAVAGSAAETLAKRLTKCDEFSSYPILDALLGVSFVKTDRELSPDVLSDQQRRVLTAIVAAGALWRREDRNVTRLLSYYGLPARKEKLAGLVAT